METKQSTKPGQNRWGSLYVIASVKGSAVARGWISPDAGGSELEFDGGVLRGDPGD